MNWFSRVTALFKPAAPTTPRVGTAKKPDRFPACLAQVLKHEGGWSEHPADPGGATNKGITLATFSSWRGVPMGKGALCAIGDDEVAAIYRARYWLTVNGDALPDGVDLAVFDYAVNSGPGRAVKALQSVLGVARDGVIGPKTLAALGRAPGPVTVIIGLCDQRLRFLRDLDGWKTFGGGWTNRIMAIEKAALDAA